MSGRLRVGLLLGCCALAGIYLPECARIVDGGAVPASRVGPRLDELSAAAPAAPPAGPVAPVRPAFEFLGGQ